MLGMAKVVALKLAVVVPAATVIDGGKVRIGLLLESVTAAPPAGAALLRVTVQVLAPFGPRLDGTHATNETCGAGPRPIRKLAEVLL